MRIVEAGHLDNLKRYIYLGIGTRAQNGKPALFLLLRSCMKVRASWEMPRPGTLVPVQGKMASSFHACMHVERQMEANSVAHLSAC